MHLHVIMHADFETPGVIVDWAKARGHTLVISKPYQGEHLPTTSAFDCFIVMGGPQSPLAIDEAPYLEAEIQFIQRAIQNNKIILGFCLGAQLIGEALGARTQRSPEKEVGIYPVTLTDAGLQDPLFQGFSKSFPVIHWHNDMPGATPTAVLLATSQGCPQQAFRYQDKVYGLQFHMEITREGIETMIKACPDDLKPSLFTQTAENILTQDFDSINNQMQQILDRLVS